MSAETNSMMRIAAVVILGAVLGTGAVVMSKPESQESNSLLGKWEPAGPVRSTLEFTSDSVIYKSQGQTLKNYRVSYETVTVKSGEKTNVDVLVVPVDAKAGEKTMRAVFFGKDSIGYCVDGESNGVVCSRLK
jgi:hypothetical protein